jgi:immune inhibitor A
MSRVSPRPLCVSPSPDVLRAIRGEMSSRQLTVHDRLLFSVAAELAAEPVGVHGLNSGVFYPPAALPAAVAGLAPSVAVRSRPTTGTLRCLVLLVDFSDNPASRSPQDFQNMLFAPGTGSLRDFYRENSYGQLDVQGNVVGWLRLPQPYSYYVNAQSGTGPDPQNARSMVVDALNIAAGQVNFAQYDSDGDGYVDGLFVVHAGSGAEADPNPATRRLKVWSHQWNIPQPLMFNGVTAYAYCTEPEDGRVGVFCHEFGHMLGLPDLYDTTYRSEGVGVWCVMGAGSWNNGGNTPGHFCLWSKTQLNWVNPTHVTAPTSLSLPAIEQNQNAAHRLWSGGQAGSEYFLIENRQRVGFDASLPADGLLIWKIDENAADNTNPGGYRVGLAQADGRRDLELGRNRGDAGDPYPGTGGNSRFDGTSTPAALDRFGSPTTVSISGIAVAGGAVGCQAAV